MKYVLILCGLGVYSINGMQNSGKAIAVTLKKECEQLQCESSDASFMAKLILFPVLARGVDVLCGITNVVVTPTEYLYLTAECALGCFFCNKKRKADDRLKELQDQLKRVYN